MGVPRLAPWIFNNFRNSKNRLNVNDNTPSSGIKQIDYLYIDANAILHSAAQQIFNYGENKSFVDTLSEVSIADKIHLTYEAFWDMIIDLMKAVKPLKLLYIAIDGTAPVAKQVQQRQRRFIAARTADSSSSFNSNCISPGTDFMNNLSVFIERKIEEFLSKNTKLTVIFSPPTDPGEGEHKIMNFIRKRMEDEVIFNKLSHAIYSPDGDLIMLCLSTYLDNIHLLRNANEPRTYDYINMSYVQRNLCSFCYASNVVSRNKYDVVNDFILAGFFVGNDFLPKVQMFYTLEEGFQSMLNVCNIISKKNKFLTKNGMITPTSFADFVQIIAKDEKAHITQQSQIKNKDERFNDVMCQRYWDPTNKVYNFEEYSKEYYSTRFPSGTTINEICKEYLKSLLWVFIYYTKGLPSWRFFYKYNYAPLLTNFGAYLATPEASGVMLSQNLFDIGNPCHPFVQLLCILPSSSKNLIPKPYCDLIEESDLNFKIDYAGKTKEHFGVALIKPSNVDEVEKKFLKVCDKSLLNNDEGCRLFFWDETEVSSIEIN
jgi:5'-3' exonuclease